MFDQFEVHTDVSGVGIEAVLSVIRGKEELPVAFYSRQLRGPEKRYSATEMEALAVVKAVDHFAHYLYGAKFKVLTDHLHSSVLTYSIANIQDPQQEAQGNGPKANTI